jgi:hypothetical protein
MPKNSPSKGRACGLALLSLLLAGSAAPAAGQETNPAFNKRIEEALARTRNVQVVYQDVLGEGPGSWDPDPRYPDHQVNCLTWLQLVLAETYGRTPQEKLQVMDRLRYFGGRPGFSFRKHFIDQWTALDPLPLRRVDFGFCPSSGVQPLQVSLDPAFFIKNIKYQCPLYHQDRRSIELQVAPGQGLVQCAGMLPEGYYVLFPVANDRYLKKYGGFSGPMGQVHSMVLEVKAPVGVPPESRDAAEFKVYHASISSGKVVETQLGSYILHLWNLYRGYVLYSLAPDWDWHAQPPMDAESERLVACEAKLKGNVGKLYENEVTPKKQP